MVITTRYLYGYREAYDYRRKSGSYIDIYVDGHKVANPTGNWFDIAATKQYARASIKTDITEFLKDNRHEKTQVLKHTLNLPQWSERQALNNGKR